MPDKTSEDLVFEKLKYPYYHGWFIQQMSHERFDLENHPLYYIRESKSSKDCQVLHSLYNNLDTTLQDLEYIRMSAWLPMFKTTKD